MTDCSFFYFLPNSPQTRLVAAPPGSSCNVQPSLSPPFSREAWAATTHNPLGPRSFWFFPRPLPPALLAQSVEPDHPPPTDGHHPRKLEPSMTVSQPHPPSLRVYLNSPFQPSHSSNRAAFHSKSPGEEVAFSLHPVRYLGSHALPFCLFSPSVLSPSTSFS